MPRGRGARDHRRERRRQEHDAQAALADHGADRGRDSNPRPAGGAHRGRLRISPRAHRPRERVPERHDPGHAASRHRAPSRQHRGVLRHRRVHRHAREVVLVGDVRAARVFRGRASRAGHPARRRGARGRRRGLPGQLPAPDSRSCGTAGTTIVFISHDLGTVERLCDRGRSCSAGAHAADGPAPVRRLRIPARGEPRGPRRSAGSGTHDRTAGDPRALHTIAPAPGDRRATGAGTPDLELEIAGARRRCAAAGRAGDGLLGYDDGLLLFSVRPPRSGSSSPREPVPAVRHPRVAASCPGVHAGSDGRPAGSTRAIDWWFGRTTLTSSRGRRCGDTSTCRTSGRSFPPPRQPRHAPRRSR